MKRLLPYLCLVCAALMLRQSADALVSCMHESTLGWKVGWVGTAVLYALIAYGSLRLFPVLWKKARTSR